MLYCSKHTLSVQNQTLNRMKLVQIDNDHKQQSKQQSHLNHSLTKKNQKRLISVVLRTVNNYNHLFQCTNIKGIDPEFGRSTCRCSNGGFNGVS